MKLLFWLSALAIFYAYFLYPSWLFLRMRFCPRSIDKKSVFPSVSIIIAARNEEEYIEAKLSDLRRLDYPEHLVEILIVSDGSIDKTNEILNNCSDARIRSVLLVTQGGKANALNRAVEEAKGDIVVFMDVRQRVAIDSIKVLAQSFADPTVGCVSGALVLEDGEEGSPRGVGSYWKMEKTIRYWESAAGSVVGATGALYAVKRDLIARLPVGTILDDVLIPMEVARRGLRVVFEPRAVVWDNLPTDSKREFRRKVRTLFGNYQLLRLAPWLVTAKNPLRFEFVSHKLFRLAVPFALIGMIFPSAFLSGFIYRLPLAIAIGVGALGVLALVRAPMGVASRLTDLALAFVLLNAAAIVAFFYFSSGKKLVWVAH